MPPTFFLVRAVVVAPLREKFDAWYATDHLPWAVKAFKMGEGPPSLKLPPSRVWALADKSAGKPGACELKLHQHLFADIAIEVVALKLDLVERARFRPVAVVF